MTRKEKRPERRRWQVDNHRACVLRREVQACRVTAYPTAKRQGHIVTSPSKLRHAAREGRYYGYMTEKCSYFTGTETTVQEGAVLHALRLRAFAFLNLPGFRTTHLLP